MSDELQTAAEPTAQEEIPNQTLEDESTGSEAAPNTESDPGKGKGDPWAAMHEERSKRQALESSVNDPNFIYEQAKKLGLTGDEPATPESPTPNAYPQESRNVGTYADYKYYSELEKSQEKYPQITTDIEDQIAITALMQGLKLSPLQAADRYYGKLNKAAETAKETKQQEDETVAESKRQAATPSSTAPSTNADSIEYEDILKRTRDFRDGGKTAEKAQMELIAWREKHRN